jgi:hypothetical protein
VARRVALQGRLDLTGPLAPEGVQPAGHVGSGWRDATGGPEAIQPPPRTVAMSGTGLRTTSRANAAAGAGSNARNRSKRCPASSPLPAVVSVTARSAAVDSSDPVPPR